MDLVEHHWWMNSSFSPPLSRIWDCRLQTDSLMHGSGASVQGTSLSSNSKGGRSRVSSKRYSSHHHSVSDGVLSYSGSPSDNVHPPRWTSPVQKFNLGKFATPSIGGSTSETSWFPCSTERQYAARTSVASCSYGSPSLLSESGPRFSSGKQPSLSFPNRNASRRPFMSTPVYPLVIHNPVSDFETAGDADTCSIGRSTPDTDKILQSNWSDSNTSIQQKFHKTITELQKVDTSPDPSTSSRREGFRWSSASSYDMGFDGENFDIAENTDAESLRSSNCHHMGDQKCQICRKFLWQKSPWSSTRIVRSEDMPIAGILPCSHVFHADCLEQVTPKTQIHDPPCPLCLKAIGDSPSVAEPLQLYLKSIRRRGVLEGDAQENYTNEVLNYMEECTMQTSSSAGRRWKGSGSSVKNHLKKHLSFKAKVAKDFFSTKVFRRTWSSSTSQEHVRCQLSLD